MFIFAKNNKTRGHYPQPGNLLPGVKSGFHKSRLDFTTKGDALLKEHGAVKKINVFIAQGVFSRCFILE